MTIYYKIKDKIFNIIKNNLFGKTYLGKRLSRSVWERQFSSGYWDYLYSEDEQDHYLGICDLYNQYKPGKKILDVGCGQGVLYHYIKNNVKNEVDFFGVDISHNAIMLAKARFGTQNFVQIDFDKEGIERKFDVIVFNETLYYFEQPLKTIEQSIKWNLNQGGYIIISMFDLPDHRKIWNKLVNNYTFVEVKEITNYKGQKWKLGILTSQVG